MSMTSTLSKTIMLVFAVVLVAAPLVFAQAGPGTTGSASDRPGTSPSTGSPGTTGSTTGTQSPSMGAMGGENAIHATVADVDHQKHTVKLHMQSGEMVELKLPEQSLASLSKGDSVQVSIHKAAGQSPMPSTQPSRPESSGTPGSTGTRSR